MSNRELKWGQTPWDNLPREELLRHVQRLYAALVAARSALSLVGHGEASGFWDRRRGSGGRALAQSDIALGKALAGHDSENVYRSFFRYAVDLLFLPELGRYWTACDGCTSFWGDEQGNLAGKPCRECAALGRHSIRRPLEWRDLAPREPAGGAS